MRYHYRIISSFDPTDIKEDTGTMGTNGYTTYENADTQGEYTIKHSCWNTHQYYVQVYPVPELEDSVEGWKYPIDVDRMQEIYNTYSHN